MVLHLAGALCFVILSLVSLASGFELLTLTPNTIDGIVENTVRVTARNVPFRHCGAATAVATNNSTGSQVACEILECFPSFLLIKIPPMPASKNLLVVVVAGEMVVAGDTLTVSGVTISPVPTTPSIAVVSTKDTTFAFTLNRSVFPPPWTTREYTATVDIQTEGSHLAVCRDTRFTDIAGDPERVLLSCDTVIPPSVLHDGAVTVIGEAAISIGGSPTNVLMSESLTFIAQLSVLRVDPAPILSPTAQAPVSLTFVMNAGRYGGTVPLCAVVTPKSGSITVVRAVFAPDFISLDYTSFGAAPGPAKLGFGATDRLGACVVVSEFASLLSVAAGALPTPRPVLAAYPPTLTARALAAGAVVTLVVMGGVSAGAVVRIGTAAADVVSTNELGCTIHFTGAPTAAAETLASLVIFDEALGSVIAHAPAVLQLAPSQPCEIHDAFPPLVLAVPGVKRLHSSDLTGSGLAAIKSAVAWHDDKAYTLDVTGYDDASMYFQWIALMNPPHGVTCEFYSSEPAATAALLAAGATPHASRLLLAAHRLATLDMPVMDVSLVSLTPSLVPCREDPCFADAIVARFADLLPFPFLMTFDDGMALDQTLRADGSIVASDVQFLAPANSLSSVEVHVALTPYFGKTDRRSATLVILPLPLDVVLVREAPPLVDVVPASATLSDISSLRVLFTLSDAVDVENQADLRVLFGPHDTAVADSGPFYFLLYVSNGSEPFSEGPVPVTITYRGEVLASYENAFYFHVPELESGVSSSSPLWLLTGPSPEEVTLKGSGLGSFASAHIKLDGHESIPARSLIVTEEGRTLRFVAVITVAGKYGVFLSLPDGTTVGPVAEFVAVDAPTIAFTEPNGTFALPGPSDTPMFLADVSAVFSHGTALHRLPVEVYAIFDSDGADAQAVEIQFTPVSDSRASILVFQRAGSLVLPGSYRLCFRSKLPEDAASTTRELIGPGALLMFDLREFVPSVTAMVPGYFYDSVFKPDAPAVFKRLFLSLANGAGNMPEAAELRASIHTNMAKGTRFSAQVISSGSNFIVLELPAEALVPTDYYTITLLDTRTARTAVQVTTKLSILSEAAVHMSPLGLSHPLLYLGDGTQNITIQAIGRGLKSVLAIEPGRHPCVDLTVSDTTATCHVSVAHHSAITEKSFFAVLKSTDHVDAYLSGFFVPRITVTDTRLVTRNDNTVDVTISYECGLDLSTVPLVPRLAGLDGEVTHFRASNTTLAFTAHRTGGAREATVELFNVASEPNTARAETFVVLVGAAITFSDSSMPTWAIVLISLGALVITAAGVLVVRARCCRCGASTEDEDDDEDGEYEYEDMETVRPAGGVQHQ